MSSMAILKNRPAKQNGGFSLLEVMAASLIITSASVALFPLQISLLNSTNDALTRQYALFELENQLEKFMSYSQSSDNNEANFALIVGGSSSALTDVDISWQVVPIFNYQAAGNNQQMFEQGELVGKRVVISAKWQNKNNKIETIQLQTVVAK